MVGNATVDGVFYSVTDGKRLALNPYALTCKRQILSTPVPTSYFRVWPSRWRTGVGGMEQPSFQSVFRSVGNTALVL